MNNLAIVILAAGNSLRLGQPKQLVMIDGQPLVARVARLASKFSNNVYCILGDRAGKISSSLKQHSVTCLTNKDWQLGMGSSIAWGVSQLGEDIEAVLILLCDQWALNHRDLTRLCQQWQASPDKIIASTYFDGNPIRRVRGVPAIFPGRYFAELKMLKKTGARTLLTSYYNEVIAIEIDNAGLDLDTPVDLVKVRDFYRSSHPEN